MIIGLIDPELQALELQCSPDGCGCRRRAELALKRVRVVRQRELLRRRGNGPYGDGPGPPRAQLTDGDAGGSGRDLEGADRAANARDGDASGRGEQTFPGAKASSGRHYAFYEELDAVHRGLKANRVCPVQRRSKGKLVAAPGLVVGQPLSQISRDQRLLARIDERVEVLVLERELPPLDGVNVGPEHVGRSFTSRPVYQLVHACLDAVYA